MTNLTQTLFRIDPTEGFVEYVKTVKPYHSKILDVLIEYVYKETISAQIRESWSWVYEFRRPKVDILYSCGYGYRWDPTGVSAPEALPKSRIISAVNQSVSDVANSFLIEPPTSNNYSVIVADEKSNQLAFVHRYVVTNTDPTNDVFTVAGDITAVGALVNGSIIHISDVAGSTSMITPYTVSSVSYNSGTDITQVTVHEPIVQLQSTAQVMLISMSFEEVPYWPSGTTVEVTGTLPTPLVSTVEYNFIPSEKIGYFTLARTRYPQSYEDFVDISTFGRGDVTITRTEPFVPGDPVQVYGSVGARNDGAYTIGTITKEGSNFRIQVLQKVNRTTPIGMSWDGNISLDIQTYSNPSYCALADAPDMHAETYIHETLKFSFELSFIDRVSSTVIENARNAAESSVTLPFSTQTGLSMLNGFDMQFFDIGQMDHLMAD